VKKALKYAKWLKIKIIKRKKIVLIINIDQKKK